MDCARCLGYKGSMTTVRIHIIDDDPDTVQVLALYFGVSIPQANVTWSSSGRQGLRTVVENRPDVVLIDIALPDLDGFETLSQLRFAVPDIPLIVLTAGPEEDTRQRVLDLGADEFISKPFECGDVMSRVASLLQGRRSQSH